MSKAQTDNSFFADKVYLRLKHLPDKKEINVLECYAGTSKIWNEIKNRSDKIINILKIEKESNKPGIYLKGDNIKFLKNINLSQFDIIDLDAYGVPFIQLEEILKQKPKAIIFVTFIQSQYGSLPIKMLQTYGYSKQMIDKIPTLFYKKGIDILKNYLAQNDIKKIFIRQNFNKHYLCFNLT